MRFTINLKLGIAFGLMIMLLVGCSIFSIVNLSALNQAITE
jgi:methyl-accepting chemotaxis protein